MNIRAATIDDMPKIAKLGGDLGYPNDEEIVSEKTDEKE